VEKSQAPILITDSLGARRERAIGAAAGANAPLKPQQSSHRTVRATDCGGRAPIFALQAAKSCLCKRHDQPFDILIATTPRLIGDTGP